MGDPSLRLTLAQADVDSMSLRDLKQLITMAGLTLDGCLERPDLRQRAREAQAALAAGAAEAAAHTGPVDAGAVEALCAVLRERFGDEALRSAGFTHFGIAETVTVLARTIAASPDEHGVPLGKVPNPNPNPNPKPKSNPEPDPEPEPEPDPNPRARRRACPTSS